MAQSGHSRRTAWIDFYHDANPAWPATGAKSARAPRGATRGSWDGDGGVWANFDKRNQIAAE